MAAFVRLPPSMPERSPEAAIAPSAATKHLPPLPGIACLCTLLRFFWLGVDVALM